MGGGFLLFGILQNFKKQKCKKLQYAELQDSGNGLGVAYVNLEGVNPFRVGGSPRGPTSCLAPENCSHLLPITHPRPGGPPRAPLDLQLDQLRPPTRGLAVHHARPSTCSSICNSISCAHSLLELQVEMQVDLQLDQLRPSTCNSITHPRPGGPPRAPLERPLTVRELRPALGQLRRVGGCADLH